MADTLSLLFELDTDPSRAVANFRRLRSEFAREIAGIRKTLTQPITLPAVRPTTPSGARRISGQADDHVKQFRRIEAEASKSARAQEREQARLNRAVQSLQRQRSAALIKSFKDEERAAVAAFRAQERAAQQASRAIANAFRGLGPGLQSLGRTLTIGITAPLLALGAASLKSAKDLDANVNTLKAFTGSAEAAERRLAQLIKTARDTPGLTTNLALTLDAQLRVAQATQEAIDRVVPAIGRLNAVSRLGDPQKFAQNLVQLVTQNFEKPDLKELVGQSPLAGQLITEIFNVDSPINAEAIKASAKKLGLTTVDAFFTAFAEAAARNQGLASVTESIGTRFDKIVDRVTVALRPLGLAILNVIEPFIEPIAKTVERIGVAFDALSKPVKTAIIVIAGIAAAAGPVLFVLGSLATGIAAVVSAAGTVAAAVAAIGLPAIAAAIAGIVIIIAEWAAVLAVLGLAWKTNFLGIREIVSGAASAVLDAFTRIKSVVNEVIQRLLPTLQSITNKILGTLTALWERYGATVVRVISVSFGIAVRALEAFTRFFGNLIDLVAKLIDGDWRGAWSVFARIIINAVDTLVNVINRLGPILRRAFTQLLVFIVSQAFAFANAANVLAAKFIASLASSIKQAAPVVRDALIDMFATAISSLDTATLAAVLVSRFIVALRRAAAESATATPDKGGPQVEVDIGGGEGIFRKKRPAAPSEGAGKGADAETRRRIRLLELEADRADAIAKQRIATENLLFDQRKTSLRDFTDFQIREEEAVLAKKKQVFAAERAEAEKLGKGRDLALGEIRLKELKAELDFADRRNQLLANQEREEFESAKEHRQALLDIQDEGDQKQLELIDSYVERYLISFEEAERRRLIIEENARQRRLSELEIQLGEAGSNVQEQQRINDEIAKLEQESANAVIKGEASKRDARRATLDAEQDYYNTLQQIILRGRQILREAAEIELGRLTSRFGDRRKFRLESLRLERAANEDEHQERLRQLEQEKQDAEKRLVGVRDAEEKLLALRRYYAELERVERQRRAEERRDEEQREGDVRDPFSSLRKRFDEFRFAVSNTNSSIAESLTSLSEQVSLSLGAMNDALRQGIVGWILYGDSIGKAFKAALAQQSASLAAEFALQALKHALYAAGSLAFGNFAAAAKHAAVAAAFAAAATGLGFAGRALSKSAGLFNRGRSETASTAVGGGTEPRNRDFQNAGSVVESSSQAAREGSSGALSRREANDRAIVDALKNHTAATLQLNTTISRLKTQPKGVVVADGLDENPAAAGKAVLVHSNSDGDFNESIARNLGFGR